MINTRWVSTPVLELRCGHVIATRLGAGRVRGWTWLPNREQVRVTVTLIDGTRHTEAFNDRDHAMRQLQR